MGAVTVVQLGSVSPIDLGSGSWSKMLITSARTTAATSSLGYSVFSPGTALQPVRHDVEEFAYVVRGNGELQLDGGTIGFSEGDAIHIPPRTWHAVANLGDADVVMVFGFPYPEYPPTERR